MTPAWLIVLGVFITVSVLFTPYNWFLRDGGYSRVDKCQVFGVVLIFIGVIWEVINVLRLP